MESQQTQIIKQCLIAVASGEFIQDHDFHTVIGLKREEVAAIVAAWPHANSRDKHVELAINNSLLNLVAYPRIDWSKLSKYLSVSKGELIQVFLDWRRATDRVEHPLGPKWYFDCLE